MRNRQLPCRSHELNASGNKPETVSFAEFVAFFEQHLHSEADPKERLFPYLFLDNADQPGLTEHSHRVREGSYAGKYQAVSGAEVGGAVGYLVLKSEEVKSVFHAEQVSCAVVNYRNHSVVPFVFRNILSEFSFTCSMMCPMLPSPAYCFISKKSQSSPLQNNGFSSPFTAASCMSCPA